MRQLVYPLHYVGQRLRVIIQFRPVHLPKHKHEWHQWLVATLVLFALREMLLEY